MRLDNFIQTAMNNVLKNPILSILRDINFSSILKQSNFIKRDIGKSPYLVILHFLYMFVINRKISSFMKYSNDSFLKESASTRKKMYIAPADLFGHSAGEIRTVLK